MKGHHKPTASENNREKSAREKVLQVNFEKLNHDYKNKKNNVDAHAVSEKLLELQQEQRSEQKSHEQFEKDHGLSQFKSEYKNRLNQLKNPKENIKNVKEQKITENKNIKNDSHNYMNEEQLEKYLKEMEKNVDIKDDLRNFMNDEQLQEYLENNNKEPIQKKFEPIQEINKLSDHPFAEHLKPIHKKISDKKIHEDSGKLDEFIKKHDGNNNNYDGNNNNIDNNEIDDKDEIEYIVTLGDSLSDRGQMDKRHLLGFIPMAILSGLRSKSPLGRFTNGYVWDDSLGAMLAAQFLIHDKEHMKKDEMQFGDKKYYESDKLDDQDYKKNEEAYNLDQYGYIDYNEYNYMRNYNEGGATAGNFEYKFTFNLPNEFPRLIVSNLDQQREHMFKDDKKLNITPEQKRKTLVVEWMGANDLITVNKIQDNKVNIFDEVDFAIESRIKNVEELIKNGYCKFALLNLPNLELTPRFQSEKMSNEDRIKARWVTEYFNARLQSKVDELLKKHNDKNLKVDVLDIDKIVSDVYVKIKTHDPEYQALGFDSAKTDKPYVDSNDFKIDKKNHTSPAPGYMFWDDVHPTAEVHRIIGQEFFNHFSEKYRFHKPKLNSKPVPARFLLVYFMHRCPAYKAQLEQQMYRDFKPKSSGFSDMFSHTVPDIMDYKQINDEEFCKKTLLSLVENTGYYQELRKLNWINGKDELDGDLHKLLYPHVKSRPIYQSGKLYFESPEFGDKNNHHVHVQRNNN